MFCKNCGKLISDGAKFCPSCGMAVDSASVEGIKKEVENFSKNVDEQLESSIDEIRSDIAGNNNLNGGRHKLRDNRGLLVYILLSIITCGIYSYYFIYSIAKDLNIACEGDGENTGGLASFIIFSFLTCGIYGLYWQYKIGNRIQANANRYGLIITENGTSILLWDIFGLLLCGIGTYVGTYILIKNVNIICAAYNRKYNLIG